MVIAALPARWLSRVVGDAGRAWRLNTALSSLAICAALWFVGPYARQGLCLLEWLSGHACPFCGMTHGVARGLHGDWSAALAAHPLAPAVTVLLVTRVVIGAILARWPHLVSFERERSACRWINGGVVGACLFRYALLWALALT